jgi:hypothetical protein
MSDMGDLIGGMFLTVKDQNNMPLIKEDGGKVKIVVAKLAKNHRPFEFNPFGPVSAARDRKCGLS